MPNRRTRLRRSGEGHAAVIRADQDDALELQALDAVHRGEAHAVGSAVVSVLADLHDRQARTLERPLGAVTDLAEASEDAGVGLLQIGREVRQDRLRPTSERLDAFVVASSGEIVAALPFEQAGGLCAGLLRRVGVQPQLRRKPTDVDAALAKDDLVAADAVRGRWS